MGGQRISRQRWEAFVGAVESGLPISAAATRQSIDYSAALRFVRADGDSSGHAVWLDRCQGHGFWEDARAEQLAKVRAPAEGAPPAPDAAGIIDLKALRPEAREAMSNGRLFRERYFGRVTVYCQDEAWDRLTTRIHECRATGDRAFIVMNLPPGIGKTTLMHDLSAWLIALDRSVRIGQFSNVSGLAVKNNGRLRRTLERTTPPHPRAVDLARGTAQDAVATLAGDFGAFKPLNRDVWNQWAFVVAQPGDAMVVEKEATSSAFGFDQSYIGNRLDLIIADDMETRQTSRAMERTDQRREDWDGETETRLEPGGVLILVGQRLGPDDLYAYAKSQVIPFDMDELEEMGLKEAPRRYEQIIYKAHDETKCTGVHARNIAQPWPEGCLLDPKRLPWAELKAKKPSDFAIIYQQEDSAPGDSLVDKAWVHGGVDRNGERHDGAWDDRHVWGRVENIHGPTTGIITVDPSSTKWWAVQCIGEGAMVTVPGGEKPIETVAPGDRVLTRKGWRRVLAAQMTGIKPTVEVTTSAGRALRATADHLIATADGWVEAGRLAPGVALAVGNPLAGPTETLPFAAEGEVVADVLVPVGAMGPSGACEGGRAAPAVLGPAHRLQVIGVDARRNAAKVLKRLVRDGCAAEAQHAEGDAVRQPFAKVLAHSAVTPRVASPSPQPALSESRSDRSRDGASAEVPLVDGLDALGVVRSVPTANASHGGGCSDGRPAMAKVHVGTVAPGPTMRVYDLTVEGAHEFEVEGVIVHNCWLYDEPEDEQAAKDRAGNRHLLDLQNVKMSAPELLGYNLDTHVFYGILEQWWHEYARIGHRLHAVVVEQNHAQRFLLQYDHAKTWSRLRGVTFVPHNTASNKLDTETGVSTIGEHWRYGRVRLPGRTEADRIAIDPLVRQVTNWPRGSLTDQVMANWFLEVQLPNIVKVSRRQAVENRSHHRPSWLPQLAGRR